MSPTWIVRRSSSARPESELPSIGRVLTWSDGRLLLEGFPGLVEQPRILDRDHRLLGERLQQGQLLVAERAPERPADPQRADAPALEQHRRERHRPDPQRSNALAGSYRHDVGIHVRVREHLPVEDRDSRRGVARERPRREGFLELIPARPGIGADLQRSVLADPRDADEIPGEEPLAALEDHVEHRLGIGDRIADRAQHLPRSPLLLERLPGLVEQAHVLDRDRRLVGEGLHQRDLLVGEPPRFHPPERDGADRAVLAHQRHREDRVVADAALQFAPEREFLLRRLCQVFHVDHGAVDDRAAGGRTAAERHEFAFAQRRRAAIAGSEFQRVSLDQNDRRFRGLAQFQRAFGNGVEHRPHVPRRVGNHAQDFADRRLLLERARQLAGSLLDLALEPGVRLAQLRRHRVEAGGQRLQFVAGAHVDLLLELAGADALRAFGQRPDGTDHPARERQRAESGDGETAEEQKCRAQDRRVELRIDLRHRLLDENLPAQQVDRRGRCQHRVARRVIRNHRVLVGAAAAAADRRLHVREVGKIGLAQHQSDVRVGDQEAVAVDDVRLALVADLDPRHDVPYELEVDVGDRHRAVVAARADGDRHVRLGFLAEIHRPEPGLAPPRVTKRRLPPAIPARVDGIHAQPRDGELLATRGTELRDIGDLRRLAQELQELDPAQFHVGGVELRQRRELELLLDRPDILFDARRGRDRLFVLQVGERRLGLLVREIQADPAGHEQRARHQRENQQQVLPEQAAAVGVLRARTRRGGRRRPGDRFGGLDVRAGLDRGCRHCGFRLGILPCRTPGTLRAWLRRVKNRVRREAAAAPPDAARSVQSAADAAPRFGANGVGFENMAGRRGLPGAVAVCKRVVERTRTIAEGK
jgi:hypothetical protein